MAPPRRASNGEGLSGAHISEVIGLNILVIESFAYSRTVTVLVA